MTDSTVIPVRAGSDIAKAAAAIRERVFNKPPEPGKPGQPAASAEANRDSKPAQEEGSGEDDGSTKSIPAKPAADNEVTTGKADEADASQRAPAAEKTGDREELADTIDGLASQLGMEPDDLANHLKAEVKINGQKRQANLKELIAGFQMESDYRNKTAEVAEQRRQTERIQQQYLQEREHLTSRVTPLVQHMEQLVAQDDQKLQQLLNEGDILEYERLKHVGEQRKATLIAAKQEQQRLDEQRAQERQGQLVQHVADQERILIERRPEWGKDTERGRKELSAIRQYLKDEGLPAEQADQLYEALPLLIADKARRWDDLQKVKNSKLNEVRSVPKFQTPGPTKPPEASEKTVFRANLTRLRRTGNIRDAATALKSGGFVKPAG